MSHQVWYIHIVHQAILTARLSRHATSGSSSTDGGVCIDLSEMRAVSVDPKSKIVTAQGGCLWADVDKAAEEHGLAVVGGTVNSTGVGGLSLGGGLG
jgi:FAD/FMN-containing dehydrogenase